MGHYTTLDLNCSLRHDTPQNVIDTLDYYINLSSRFPPEERLFITSSGRNPLSSSENNIFKHAWMIYTQKSWDVSVRSCVKNYEGEIEQFLAWLKPYIAEGFGTRNMYAYTLSDTQHTPTIYYLND